MPHTDTPSLAAFLDDAEAGHATQPAATAAALQARAARLPADADGARALRLAEHVALAHLGDPAVLAAVLQALPPALAQADTTAATVQRLQWALAMATGSTATTQPPDAPRWRALQNVVLALAARQHWPQASALLAQLLDLGQREHLVGELRGALDGRKDVLAFTRYELRPCDRGVRVRTGCSTAAALSPRLCAAASTANPHGPSARSFCSRRICRTRVAA